MSFLFGRSTTSVKVHPAIYYADLAAERARCYLYRAYHPWPVQGTDDDDAAAATDLSLKMSKVAIGKLPEQTKKGQGKRKERKQVVKPKFIAENWSAVFDLPEGFKDSMFYI